MIEKAKSVRWYSAVDPDVRLMLRAAEDDVDAFEELIRRYRGRVMSMLVQHVRSEEVAEELAQEAFLRAYLARGRYVPRSKFSTWLFTIVKNLALNAKRSDARRREVNLLECRASDFPNPKTGTPLDIMESNERQRIVRRSLARLTRLQNEAITLRCYRHMSYAEAAVEMKTSPQAVKSLLMRARTELRKILQGHFESI